MKMKEQGFNLGNVHFEMISALKEKVRMELEPSAACLTTIMKRPNGTLRNAGYRPRGKT